MKLTHARVKLPPKWVLPLVFLLNTPGLVSGYFGMTLSQHQRRDFLQTTLLTGAGFSTRRPGRNQMDNVVPPQMLHSVPGNLKVIDSHLHVWSNGQSPFPYAAGQEPPEQMQSNCGAEDLLERMSEARVSGSLIVQPINHKFDHSYVKSVIDQHPNKFKGMCLANPSLSPDEAVANIQDLHGQGFVGIRFNPYLWPDNGKMSNEAGSMMFAKAAELGMPVGIMCFKGLDLHFDDIKTLLEGTPETKVILDHFGFFMQQAKDIESDDKIFAQLLELSNYPQVYVKTSAYFRNSRGGNGWPYADLAPRLEALLEHYGSERLLWGSDYPFVKNECGYKESLDALFKWREESTDLQDKLTDSDLENIFYGTATKLFGSWGG